MAEAIEMDDLDHVEETNEVPPEDEDIDNDNPLDISIPVPSEFSPDIGAAPNVRWSSAEGSRS